MIVTELYDGQGLGNQLWCYTVTRCIADIRGYDFGIMGRCKFKGREFIDIDFGNLVTGGVGPEGGPPHVLPDNIIHYYKERLVREIHTGLDISPTDLNLLNVKDNIKIDGIMQSIKYIKDYKDKIYSWIQLKPFCGFEEFESEDICIIHIRGGDFNGSLAWLDFNYYNNAMSHFKRLNPNIQFYVVTDDIWTSQQILPNIPIIGSSNMKVEDSAKASHHMGGPINIDYNILNRARNIIMAASSFGWWAVWTNRNVPNVIAPKYWAGYKQNCGYWSTGEIQVDEWKYLDLNNNIL